MPDRRDNSSEQACWIDQGAASKYGSAPTGAEFNQRVDRRVMKDRVRAFSEHIRCAEDGYAIGHRPPGLTARNGRKNVPAYKRRSAAEGADPTQNQVCTLRWGRSDDGGILADRRKRAPVPSILPILRVVIRMFDADQKRSGRSPIT